MKFFSHRFLPCTVLTIILAMCSACGQKGKLILPVKPAAISTPYPTAEPKKVDSDMESGSGSESKSATKPADTTPDQLQEKN